MEEQHLDLGLVLSLDVEAFGEPGGRTFRLHARTEHGAVSLWLEKEQVVMLGSALAQMLHRLPQAAGLEPILTESDSGFRGDLDVKVGTLAVGFDPEVGGFTFDVTDFLTAVDLEIDGIHLVADRAQIEEMEAAIVEIVSGSRPRCPLCGTPLTDQPHFCPSSNGHAHLSADA